ncbi:DUF4190 domain-containing protein [Antribacter sp. KLBMP9083]|uniref:DUF4190 domain-containing protein n=1 Tax=Antribacter soli TaxID=2910976 RepID=A0AA41U7Q6_9MICO|nr:DUF4190 domain-containing protein [Antribacter soli]MCF4121846.1 DUF4190 domain-containing protein [Antribacter soli]
MTQPDAGWTQPAPEQRPAPAPAGPVVPQQPYGGPAQPEQQYAQPYPGGYQPAPYGYAPRPPMPKNDLGVLSLVFGLLGLLMFGLVGGIPAVIVGLKAKEAVRQGLADNEGMATAGIVTGWIGIAWSGLAILGMLAWFVFFAAVVGTAGYSSTY